MNLRISENQLRFRITRGELEQLLTEHTLELGLELGKESMHYRILAQRAESPMHLEVKGTGFTLVVDRSALESFAAQLPSREGMEHPITLNGQKLLLILEVDVRKSPKG